MDLARTHQGRNSFNSFATVEEVQEVTKVGTGCGQCVESNRALVNELLGK
ncbi:MULTISPECIES: (2Fe-2S)-binding protein [unclassified Clostridium]|nr:MULTISPECIES: (2Fe-2S)-binding protein [unclassified Clostridium]